MTQVVAYSDEYGMQAEGWDDLGDVAAVMRDVIESVGAWDLRRLAFQFDS